MPLQVSRWAHMFCFNMLCECMRLVSLCCGLTCLTPQNPVLIPTSASHDGMEEENKE